MGGSSRFSENSPNSLSYLFLLGVLKEVGERKKLLGVLYKGIIADQSPHSPLLKKTFLAISSPEYSESMIIARPASCPSMFVARVKVQTQSVRRH